MDKPELRLTRWCHGVRGVFGTLTAPGLTLFTCENPWLDNQRSISCVPTGKYNVVRYQSQTRGRCWLLVNVPGRDAILFHSGNTIDDTEGCILPGLGVGCVNGQWGVISSKRAMIGLNTYLDPATSFNLTIDILHPYRSN